MKETVKRFIMSFSYEEKTVRRIPKKKRYIEIYVKRGESVSVYQVKR